jgi:hypothetical protein
MTVWSERASSRRRRRVDGAHSERAAESDGPPARAPRYQSPRIERLGTLGELTKGGNSGPDDGFGGAGGNGSV